MNACSKPTVRILALGFVAFLVMATFAPVHAQSSGQIAAPPNSRPYGKSYAEWSQAWWQWAYGLPADGHPLFDETGAYASAGQSGPVWFLGGVFNVSGTAHRTITVPKGTALFFPVINVEWDNVCPPGSLTIEELRALAAFFADLATDLACEVDGVPVPNMSRFRTPADAFSVTFPDNNLFQLFGCDAPAGTYYPFVGDGYYVMLGPLSKGHHTLHFTGTFGPPVGFTLDITYDIDVVDRHAGPVASAAIAPPLSKTELARVAETMKAAPTQPTPGLGGRGAIDAALSPSPLRDHGTLRFVLSEPGLVEARLFDVSGRVVRVLAERTFFSSGVHELRVDRSVGADTLAPGMYFYSIQTPEGIRRGRITIVE